MQQVGKKSEKWNYVNKKRRYKFQRQKRRHVVFETMQVCGSLQLCVLVYVYVCYPKKNETTPFIYKDKDDAMFFYGSGHLAAYIGISILMFM